MIKGCVLQILVIWYDNYEFIKNYFIIIFQLNKKFLAQKIDLIYTGHKTDLIITNHGFVTFGSASQNPSIVCLVRSVVYIFKIVGHKLAVLCLSG